MTNEAARQLRIAADEIEAAALSDAEIDLFEMIAFHLRDKLKGGITDRARQTKLMIRMLQR